MAVEEDKQALQSLAARTAQLLPDPTPDPSDREATLEHCVKIKNIAATYFKEQKYDWAGKTYTDVIECLLASFGGSKMAMLQGASTLVHTCYSNAALCALKIGEYGQCRDMCTSALDARPTGLEKAKVLFRYGQALLALGQPREAGKQLLEAAQLDPKNGAIRQEYNKARQALGLSTTSKKTSGTDAGGDKLKEAKEALRGNKQGVDVEAFTKVVEGGQLGGAADVPPPNVSPPVAPQPEEVRSEDNQVTEEKASAPQPSFPSEQAPVVMPQSDEDARWWYDARGGDALKLYDEGKHKDAMDRYLEMLEEALKAERYAWAAAAAFGCGLCSSALKDNKKVIYFMPLYIKLRSLLTTAPDFVTEGGEGRPPKMHTCHRLLGLAHFAEDQRSEALENLMAYVEETEIEAESRQELKEELAQIHMRIASLFDMIQQPGKAIEHCQQTLKLTKVSGHLALCHDNLARLYGMVKQPGLANEHADAAAEIRDTSTLDEPQD